MLTLDKEAVPRTSDITLPFLGKGMPRNFMSPEQCILRSHVALSTGSFATGPEEVVILNLAGGSTPILATTVKV